MLHQWFSNGFIPSPPFHCRHVVFAAMPDKANTNQYILRIFLKKVINGWTKPLKSWTKQLYYDTNIAFRILVKIIQAYGVGAPELGILTRGGAQFKHQEPDPEFSWEFRSGAGVMAIWEVAPTFCWKGSLTMASVFQQHL